MYDLAPDAGDGGSREDLVIGYVGGGSGHWARVLMNDLAQEPALGGVVRLYDIDRARAERNARLGNRIQDRSDAVGDWRYEAVADLGKALSGATFVILSTADPPADTMVHDLDIPAEYGIHQTVGDTVGPGGCLRAMRSIPVYRRFAAAIRRHCPDTWVINYTNPMTVCTRTLYAEFPGINALGLCHEVSNTQAFLAGLVEAHLDVSRPDRSEIDVDVTGINHFTWLTGARWRGNDLLEVLAAERDRRRPFPNYGPGDMAEKSWFVDNQEVTFDLYDRFGAFPAAGDRHLAEFVPWYLRVDDPRALHRWGIKRTPSEYRLEKWTTDAEQIDRYLEGEDEFDLDESGEEVVEIMRALLGGAPIRTNVNVPNGGQAPDLPDEAVVETNALITGEAVTPLRTDCLPSAVRTHVLRHVSNQETLVEAGLQGDVDMAFRAFLSDPLVSVGRSKAEALFRELITAQEPYLDDWNLEKSTLL